MNKEIREEFEEWFSRGDANCQSIERSASDTNRDGYKLMQTQVSWVAWCAAKKKAALEEVTKLGELQTLMEENEKLKKEIERLNFLLRGEE